MMDMYYTRKICPILSFTKELKKLSNDNEPVKKITTLKDIGIEVDPYPEFEQFDIKFEERAKEYQNLIFENSQLNKNLMDSYVSNYLDQLLEYCKYGAYYDDEKKAAKKLYKYTMSKFDFNK